MMAGRRLARWIGRSAAVWCLVGSSVSGARADEAVTLFVAGGPSADGYVRRVQPVMVETLMVVRQPLDAGRHRRLDQRGQLVALESLIARVRQIQPPESAAEAHRWILEGLEQFRSSVRLRIDGAVAAADRRMWRAEEMFREASRRLQEIARTGLPVCAIGDEAAGILP